MSLKSNPFDALRNFSSDDEDCSSSSDDDDAREIEVEGSPPPHGSIISSDGYSQDLSEEDGSSMELEHSQYNLRYQEAITSMERAALMQIHTSDTLETKLPEDDSVEIEEGIEMPIFPKNVEAAELGFQFVGRCYLCSCVGHSLKLCPNKYCTLCKGFGHSPVNCPNRVRISRATARVTLAAE